MNKTTVKMSFHTIKAFNSEKKTAHVSLTVAELDVAEQFTVFGWVYVAKLWKDTAKNILKHIIQ